MVFEFAGGTRFAFTGSWCSPGLETSWNGSWRVSGERGTATWDGDHEPRAHDADEQPISAPVGHRPEQIAGSLAEFVGALRTGDTPWGEAHSNVLSLAHGGGRHPVRHRGTPGAQSPPCSRMRTRRPLAWGSVPRLPRRWHSGPRYMRSSGTRPASLPANAERRTTMSGAGQSCAPADRRGRLRVHGRRSLPGLAQRATLLRPAAETRAQRGGGPERRRGPGGRRPARIRLERDRLAAPRRTERHRPDRHLHPGRQSLRDRNRGTAGRQARAVREAAGQHGRGGGADGRRRPRRGGARDLGDVRIHLPADASPRPGPAAGRRRPDRCHPSGAGTVPPGLAGRPGRPDDLATGQNQIRFGRPW